MEPGVELCFQQPVLFNESPLVKLFNQPAGRGHSLPRSSRERRAELLYPLSIGQAHLQGDRAKETSRDLFYSPWGDGTINSGKKQESKSPNYRYYLGVRNFK